MSGLPFQGGRGQHHLKGARIRISLLPPSLKVCLVNEGTHFNILPLRIVRPEKLKYLLFNN